MKRFLAVVPICLLLDFATKYWAEHVLRLLPGGQLDAIPRVLEFRYAQNTGVAFSRFSGSGAAVLLLTGLLIIGVALFILFSKDLTGAVKCLLWAVFAGGVGNFVNRLMTGYVTDFLNPVFIRFAIFNVADIFVTCGALLAVVAFLWAQKKPERA